MLANTFYLLSLGCAKNVVDAECMSQLLRQAGWTALDRPERAEALIVNTCGFIKSAKEEAIAAILDLADYKRPAGQANFLLVTGCLGQRYAAEIKKQLPEVDAVLGTADYGLITSQLEFLQKGRRDWPLPQKAGSIAHLKVARQPSTPASYAYLKIAEGCSNNCSYCAIPAIRGQLLSRPLPDLLEEAGRLADLGYKELILIAQDTGRYGLDIYGKRMLAQLLDQICQIKAVERVRVLYTYSDGITDELIQLMQDQPKIARYLDLPIQHGSDRILKLMRRHDDQASIRRVIRRLRQALPDIIIRTTIMVGFPTETEADFEAMLQFLDEMAFDRLGCFVFSPEEGTAAYAMRPRVHYRTGQRRQRQLMEKQALIAHSKAQARIGRLYSVVLDSVDESGIFYIGRSYGEAPEVDPVIYVAAASADIELGQTCQVLIRTADAYEMTGVTT